MKNVGLPRAYFLFTSLLFYNKILERLPSSLFFLLLFFRFQFSNFSFRLQNQPIWLILHFFHRAFSCNFVANLYYKYVIKTGSYGRSNRIFQQVCKNLIPFYLSFCANSDICSLLIVFACLIFWTVVQVKSYSHKTISCNVNGLRTNCQTDSGAFVIFILPLFANPTYNVYLHVFNRNY